MSAAETPTAAGDILWLIDDASPEQIGDVWAGIAEALAAEREGHLLGDDALDDRVRERSRPLSGCAFGLSFCGSAEAMAFDALGLGLMIRLRIDHRDAQIKINYEMVDRRGEVASSGEVVADDERRAGFELVRQLFDAVGVVSFESSPSGAVVEVDGQKIGETPMSRQFGVGSYAFRMHTDTHESAAGTFEVRTGEAHRVEVELDERSGSLRVRGAPDEALIWVDGQAVGGAREIVDLDAGRHVVELRAEGYETYQRTVEIEPAALTDVEADMRKMPTLFRDVSASEIADHRFQFDVGLEGMAQRTAFPAARGDLDGEPVVFDRWIDEENPDGEDRRRSLSSFGLRLGFSWEGQRLGIGFLSASLARRSVDQPIYVRAGAEGLRLDGTTTAVRTLQLRPMQGRVRFFYENLAPFVQAGLGVSFHWLDVQLADDRELRLRQAEPFGALEMGVRYHFDPRWSVGASVRLQHYVGDALGTERAVGITVGTGLRDLPGMEPQPPGEL